jgi:hypothetical protein
MSETADDIFVLRPNKQTLKAWEPFWDCVTILFEFQNSDVDEDRAEWRLYWVAGIALLRTIGHVLAKSDAAISTNHKNQVDKLWAEWKSDLHENKIFWNFIENERNNILKTYTFGATLAQDETGFYVTYAGEENAFSLFRESVYWWREQLLTLEGRI